MSFTAMNYSINYKIYAIRKGYRLFQYLVLWPVLSDSKYVKYQQRLDILQKLRT
jgi:hypothetical protein